MTQVSGFDKTPVKSEDGTRDSGWTEEHDCIPLKHRLKLLLASNRLSNIGAAEAANDASSVSTPPVNSVIKREQQQCDSRGFVSACFEGDGRVGRLSGEQNLADQSEVYDTDVSAKCALQHVLSEDSTNVNVKCDDNRLTSSLANSATGFSGSRVGAMKIKPKFPDDVLDHLDHISMKERQMMLLSRRSQRLTQIAFEGMSPELSSAAVNVMNEPSAAITKRESYSDDNESSAARNHGDDILKTECQSSNDTIAVPSCTTHQCLALPHLSEQSNATTYVKKNGRICSSGNFFPQNESRVVPDVLSGNHMASPSSAFIKVKVESVDINNSRSQDMSTAVNFSFGTMGPVKSELEITDEPFGDRIDHMLLRERMKLLASLPDMGISGNADCVRNIVPSVLDSKPIASKSTKPPRVNRPRKKRKTATDSIETALEEDAPGLLKVLIDKGVSLTEIKLYGETESNEAFDDSCIEESFSELEDVISKLVFQRESHLKLTPVRCSKGEKACYYLASLISLVEQARYLQFRKWPVEWGWCRDLQSFIFVFERHNRIVLERPEYGYATYFFELVDSLPIDWQIKRLVTTMKLTSCSRVTLIENKALMVAEDLSEGEARVLMEYGWMPNSGLGTMLNYRDRVVHDRKNDGETSEWRSKIGKLLMDGYHGGTIFYTELPKRVMEYNSPEVKLEF